ncbi:MAG: ABC transporter substrate-binding protein [Pseudomonadota bacterium]
MSDKYRLKKSLLTRRQALTLTAIAAGSACVGASAAPAVTSPRAGARVAAILPLSGDLKLFGEQARLGLEVAALEINQSNGVLGRELIIDYFDDEARPTRAKSMAERVSKSADYLAVLGPITSACRNAMSPVLEGAGIPLLYATDYEGGDCGPSRFYFNSVPNQVTKPLLTYLLDQYAGEVYLLGADYIWPRRMFVSCENIIASRGRRIAGKQFVPLQGLSDYNSLINDIQKSNASMVVQALPGLESEQFVAAAHRAGLFPQASIGVLGALALYTRSIRAIDGVRAFGCSPFVETDGSTRAKNFVTKAKHTAPKGVAISAYAATHYSALSALVSACAAKEDVSREAIIAGLAGLEYETPSGQLQIDAATHHTSLNMCLAKIEVAGPTMIGTSELIFPDRACSAGG